MARSATAREILLALLKDATQAQVSALTGISVRQIRRIKNGDRNRAGVWHDVVSKRATVQKAIPAFRKHQKRDRIKSQREARSDTVTPKNVPIQPRGNRRTLYRYKKGHKTNDKYKSEWINFDMRDLPRDEIEMLLDQWRAAGRTIQFIYEIMGENPDISGQVIKNHRGEIIAKRTSSGPMNLKGAGEWYWNNRVLRHLEEDEYGDPIFDLLYIGVLDAGHEGTRSVQRRRSERKQLRDGEKRREVRRQKAQQAKPRQQRRKRRK